MLGELRVIVQRVSAANDLDTALSIIVSCVRETLHTNVCSVYLLDTDVDGYVLMASEGLNKKLYGKLAYKPTRDW